MIPSVPGFHPAHSDATTSVSKEDASRTTRPPSQDVGTDGSGQGGHTEASTALRMAVRKTNRLQKEWRAHRKDPEAVLKHGSALHAELAARGTPSSANVGGVHTLTGERYSENSFTTPSGNHFLGQLQELENQITTQPAPSPAEMYQTCQELNACAQIFAHQDGMTLADVQAGVLAKYGLNDKDPASFPLTEAEYRAIAWKLGSLYRDAEDYTTNISAQVFAPIF